MTLLLARALAEQRDGREDAAAILAQFQAAGFDNLRINPMWSTALILTAETANLLGLVEVCRAVRALLLPFGGPDRAHRLVGHRTHRVRHRSSGGGLRRLPSPKHTSEQAVGLADRLHAPALADLVKRALERFT